MGGATGGKLYGPRQSSASSVSNAGCGFPRAVVGLTSPEGTIPCATMVCALDRDGTKIDYRSDSSRPVNRWDELRIITETETRKPA